MHKLKINKKHFIVNDQIKNMIDEINLVPEYAGTIIAREIRDKIIPTINKYKNSNLPKVILENKAEWMFLCGKEAKAKAHIKGEFIVTNNYGEMIGIGKRSERGIKPVIDLGDFLRRESRKR